MKTPEEIKKGLAVCSDREVGCNHDGGDCPYADFKWCHDLLTGDSLAYINQLEEQIAKRDRLLAALGVSICEGDQHESV